MASFQPIRRRLPLLISLLLGAAVGVFTWAAYQETVGVLRSTGEQRVSHASQRVATTLETSARGLRRESRRAASDTSIRAVFLRPDSATRGRVRGLLEQTVENAAQVVALELLDEDGRSVLSVGRITEGYPSIDSLTIDWDSVTDRTRIGRIRLDVEPPQYRVISAVMSGDRALGYFVQHRLLSTGENFALLEGVIGEHATLLLGNASGDGWTDLEKQVNGPSVPSEAAQVVRYTGDEGRAEIAGMAPVGATPWLAVVSEPRDVILAPARDHLRSMIQVAVLVVALGTLAGWLLSRQITGPLVKISDAADAIAKGDLSRRVPLDREDELGSLAKSFNSMAEQVGDFTHGLEKRVEQRTMELREAQSALVRRERLAILGQLAGSVGHELRNPLGVMTNAVYYLEAVLATSPDMVKEYLGILRTQIGLSEKIISDLLDYARVKPPQQDYVKVDELVQEQRSRLLPHDGIRVVTDFPDDLPPVYVDRVQVGQIVLNLLTNAVQAMPDEGGTLTLRGRGVNGARVVLEVEDTGCGIAPEEQEKVFEPLFTTKARGIGLGLAVSRGLAQANGGSLGLVSTIGRGTTFSLELPTRPEAVA